ncbi:unnamed protein product [Allacma fusca]|uniref:Fucosyltransferase n=1 Tax=Allacma fusca TaxID=39272 RepID=A0A8J2KES2_9HEXA|nr:unnamed protein product [Allacma fusca]
MEIGVYYKFYLSFENSLCKDYLTEKVFEAYSAGMVPVVYGGANYDLFLPRGSYINVESFPSTKSLADYLLYLDQNPSEYLKYFKWKTSSILVSDHTNMGNGYCQLCEKLHKDYPLGITKVIPNVTEWIFMDGKQGNPSCRAPEEW